MEVEITKQTPNATTLEAMKEAENVENLTTVDMDNIDTFIKSLTDEGD
jgi:hypothetical protein